MVKLDADVGTIVKQLLGKGGKKPAASAKVPGAAAGLRNVIIFAIGVFMATGAYVQFYYLPHQKTLKTQIEKLEKTKAMKEELAQLRTQEASYRKKLKDNHAHYMEVIGSYGERGKLEELYDTISSIAAAQSLIVVNVRAADGDGVVLEDMVLEKTINVQLQGRFQQYLQFREQLGKAKPLLGLKSEVIELGEDGGPGGVVIRLVLLDYSIDKAHYEEVLNHDL